jgi:hypothetical protein
MWLSPNHLLGGSVDSHISTEPQNLKASVPLYPAWAIKLPQKGEGFHLHVSPHP